MAYEGGRCLTDVEISDYVNGRMTDEEANFVEKHEEGCDACFDKLLNFNDLGPEQSGPPDRDIL